jgi:hypothetical protein
MNQGIALKIGGHALFDTEIPDADSGIGS